MDYFPTLRHILTRQSNAAEKALFALAEYKVIEGRLTPEWPLSDPAILVDTNGGDEAGGSCGRVIHPTLEIWCYGADGEQAASKTLEAAVADVLNGVLDITTPYGSLMSSIRESPATFERDPDLLRAFQRATYRTWFSSITG